MRVNSFNDFSIFLIKNSKNDPKYCNRVAERFIQNNLRAARKSTAISDLIFQPPLTTPEDIRWSTYLQGLAELLINMGAVPSYNVTWITSQKLEKLWCPVSEDAASIEKYRLSTPPEFIKRNIVTGDGIIKAR